MPSDGQAERRRERARMRATVPPSHNGGARMLRLSPERLLQHAAKRDVDSGVDRCAKCGSTFVVREPAFLHCRYCGKMTRVEAGSLLDQELFEIRSGLRLAS